MALLYYKSIKITKTSDGSDVTANVDGHSPVRLVDILDSTAYEFTYLSDGVWYASVPAGIYKWQLYGSGGYADDAGLTASGSYIVVGRAPNQYTKRHVQITGTVDSPQTLTTGTAPLATPDDYSAYPSDFVNASDVAILIISEQERGIVLVEGNSYPQISSGNVVFKVGENGIGETHEDGNIYATIVIVDLR